VLKDDDVTNQCLLNKIDQRRINPDDPIAVLVALWESATRLSRTLTQLAKDDNYQSTLTILESIDASIHHSEWYLREESYAYAMGKGQSWGKNAHFTQPIADGVSFEWVGEQPRFTFPLWMLGYGKLKDAPPPWHGNRPYVREQIFWNALIRRLTETNAHFDPRRKPSKDVVLKVSCVTRMIHARDLDHVSVSPLVNALVYNGLVFSDHPQRLRYSIEWEQVGDEKSERLQIDILDTYSTP